MRLVHSAVVQQDFRITVRPAVTITVDLKQQAGKLSDEHVAVPTRHPERRIEI